jgi:hypothetical protein
MKVESEESIHISLRIPIMSLILAEHAVIPIVTAATKLASTTVFDDGRNCLRGTVYLCLGRH